MSGTGEPYTQAQPRIADRCLSCGGQTLFIGSGGWLTCSVIGCKAPAHEDALAALLARTEAEAVAKAEGQISALTGKWMDACDERDKTLEELSVSIERDKLWQQAEERAESAERQRDEAVKWIGRMGEEAVNAGGMGGDRDVTLREMRRIIRERDTFQAQVAALVDVLNRYGRLEDGEWTRAAAHPAAAAQAFEKRIRADERARCAKVADAAERVHRGDADSAADADQYGVWSASDGAAITAEKVAAAIRAPSPSKGGGSDA